MRILHMLFSKHKGGMEQAFLDYTSALANLNHQLITVTHTHFPLNHLITKHIGHYMLSPHGYYDLFAWHTLRKVLKTHKPDVIIAHGNRAIVLARKNAGSIPVIAVNHSYNMKRSIGAAALVTVNRHMAHKAVTLGQPKDQLFTVPNMIALENAPSRYLPKPYSTPPVIGALGRFTKEKGFDVLLCSLSLLKQRNIPFKAILAGDGNEASHLKKLATSLGLTEDDVSFPGWIEKKQDFFDKIDICCIPSRYETFGIVLLEAWKYGKPVIATNTEGPRELITPKTNGILVERDNIEALAEALMGAIEHPDVMHQLAEQAFTTVNFHFSFSKVAKQLEKVILTTVQSYQHKNADVSLYDEEILPF